MSGRWLLAPYDTLDKILRGISRADIPVEQPMRFDLVADVKTVEALGLTILPEIMVQATPLTQ